ncbi:glucan ABC transporter ATP-binding protein/ permease [Mesorhizobium sp. BAC0120]|uniref:glucan ABC transporter ATP-binding protein/ permease n=1 Tax=Mesorhizobium sp. BAC0120 TaxID=3090670 RepID=UPI00298CAA89|nr:glucan ABC transporter ATP-binding protein/ permease [Mesorhizobium sp. BAC0120]MDW6024147.1 glucan ABC transporter ATP-binding protein/ permease [Mesorhizobium sp. BAC0120]
MSLFEIYFRALRHLAPVKNRVLLISVANIVLAIVTIAEPILLGRIIDAISAKEGLTLSVWLWASLGTFNIISYVLIARGADRMAHARRAGVLVESFERVISMPLAWHHKHGTSHVLHTLLRAVESMFGLWLEFMRQHLTTAVALVLLVPTAISLDLRLSCVLILLGIAYVMIGRLVTHKTKRGQASVEGHYHRVFDLVTDSINNVTVLQSYNRINEETRALKEFSRDLIKAQYPVLDWWAIAAALHRLASGISMMAVLLIGAYLVTYGELRIGDIVTFTGFAALLISRLDQISAFVNQVSDARARLEDFYKLEDSFSEADEPDGARDLENVTGHIRFENVSFAFPNSGHGVSNISFEVGAGETVAIVGPTGAGKTTLINLLQRVFDPTDGRILIDGIDTRTVSRRSLRQSIATVFQDAGLFNRSIEQNIRIGCAEASYDQVHAAAEAASAHDFILAKSAGYDSVVGERGAQLSGGERQRIAIARAILKNAPILVLDEATSALDVETEARVKQAIDQLRQGRTTFIIAHRLTTVRDADRIIFMDQGRLVETGRFDELASSNGRFAALLRAGGLLTDEDVRRLSRISVPSEAA